MADAPALVWLRDDLRLDDQPALAAADGRPVLVVYVYDDQSRGVRTLGGASKWWLARSLSALSEALSGLGGRLDVVRGQSADIVPALAAASGATSVFWTRRYGGAEIEIDKAVKSLLRSRGIDAVSFNGQLLREPWEVLGQAGQPSRVFTPFWQRLRALGPSRRPEPRPTRLLAAPWPQNDPPRVSLTELSLTSTKPDWSGGLAGAWTPGEKGAQNRLRCFVDEALAAYPDARDRPATAGVSRLSPHLRFGEISPRRIAATIEDALAAEAPAAACEKYLSELGWREFSYTLLHTFPDLASRAWNAAFENFPYVEDKAGFKAWTKGLTGYPIVDAGMRELWRSGYMHNRVRMIAASFLIKHLLCDWRKGEAWFWDTLCDADPANNPASWQWVAGSGADAAPYFRIFNPVLQGRKFDPDGAYVRHWIPELAKLASAYIHAPWTAPAAALDEADVKLGRDYPAPIVDHDFARRRALAAFEATHR